MSTLTSIKDGSLGATSPNMSAITDGSLGSHLFENMDAVSGGFDDMTAISGYRGMQAVSGHMSSFQDGTLGGCSGCATNGLGEYFSSGLGFLDKLDTTPKKVGAGVLALGLLYLVGKKTKMIPNKRRRRSRRRRR